LKAALTDLLAPLSALVIGAQRRFVIMMPAQRLTTSISKLAKHLQAGLSVLLLAAGDTFRAAAREQLSVWGERNNVTVIAQDGGDPPPSCSTRSPPRTRRIDVVLADTAGRLGATPSDGRDPKVSG
jgi:fused signal recognition particle receptor